MIRPLATTDIRHLDGLLQRAFNTSESFGSGIARQHAIQPDGCFVADHEGLPAGMVSTVRYGDFGYIGFMGVEPDLQGMGLGKALLATAISDAGLHGCQTLLLDATPAGEPLYRSFGFETAGSSFDLRGVPIPSGPHEALDSGDLYALDFEAFGADRSRALNVLMAEPGSQVFTAPGGFLIAQEKVIGPWIARDDHTAATLLNAALAAGKPRERRVMIPAEHTSALNIAHACGFSTLREVVHMRRGKPAPWLRSRIYAHASYALG